MPPRRRSPVRGDLTGLPETDAVARRFRRTSGLGPDGIDWAGMRHPHGMNGSVEAVRQLR